MPKIYVDADSCPVKDEIVRVAIRHDLVVHMVSNRPFRLAESPLVRRVVVSGGFDAADDWIADRAGPGDIVVTGDIPLAARCVERRARAIGPTGKPFTPDNIGTALSMRALNIHLREIGEIRGGGPAFGRKDRSNFLQALEQAVQAVLRHQ